MSPVPRLNSRSLRGPVRACGVAALLALTAPFAASQTPEAGTRAPGATVSGLVRDSISHAPLAGAIVQLVAPDSLAHRNRSAVSDSLGRYALLDVADGRYTIGFLHPLLDSLGVEAPLSEVFIDRHLSVRIDLAIPSPARIRLAICGARPPSDSGGVLLGVVRDARSRAPAAGVTVIGEWLEISFTRDGAIRRVPRLIATTAENGWFALCDVPSAGTMFLAASRGADSTDVLELEVPASGFLRREMYLGPARTVMISDTAGAGARTDTLPPPTHRLRSGDGRVSGTVVTMAGERPLAGAVVGIPDGPQTRANERGEWTLVDAPAGTRMLEVRAVGFYPDRRSVDVVADAAPTRVALSTLKAALDTVRIMAARLTDRWQSGFEERRRSGIGRYLTAADIARRNLGSTSSLFRNMPGVRLGYASDTLITDMQQLASPDLINTLDRRVLIRGLTGNWCVPTTFINNLYIPNPSADDLDDAVRPEGIMGIEIYTEVAVPAAYMRGLSGCGAIVIWTK